MTETISRDDSMAAWMAGILDGEGCFHTAQRTKDRIAAHGSDFKIRIELRNTNPYLMQRVTEILTEWNVKYFVGLHILHHSPTKRQMLALVIQSYRSVVTIIEKTLPFLTAKRAEAQAMLDFCVWRLSMFVDQSLRGRGAVAEARQKVVRDRITQLHTQLRMLKRVNYRLQRLPRGYSGILDLTQLEVVSPE